MSILGDRIKKERENLNLTREDLAQKIGVSYSAIAMYERGEREPSNALTIKMCEIFNCTIDYLMGKTDYKNEIDYIEKNDELVPGIWKSYKELTNKFPNFKIDDICNIMLSLHSQNLDVMHYLEQELSYIPAELKNEAKRVVLFLYNVAINIPDNCIIDNPLLLNDKAQLFNIPVLGKIAAGQPILAEEHIEGYLPVDPNIYGMTIPEEYFYLKVAGNSMNKKVKNGDYALIHKQDYAEDGDIIVAIVNGDDEATMKKYKRINNDLIALEPQSDDPSYEPIYIDKNTKFQIIGKAIGQFGKF